MMTETFAGVTLPAISDDFMRENLAKTKQYVLVLLKIARPVSGSDRPIIWEHGRRNFALRESGLMPIVCPVADDSDLAGACVLVVEADEAARMMDADPAVRAGIFTYEIHSARGFPGSALPA